MGERDLVRGVEKGPPNEAFSMQRALAWHSLCREMEVEHRQDPGLRRPFV